MPLVDEFAARLFGELDYVQEGKNCEKFGRLYRCGCWKGSVWNGAEEFCAQSNLRTATCRTCMSG